MTSDLTAGCIIALEGFCVLNQPSPNSTITLIYIFSDVLLLPIYQKELLVGDKIKTLYNKTTT